MNLSPEDRLAVLDLAATKLVERMAAACDIAELIALPIDAVCQIVGLSPSQVKRQLATRPMGKRKLGVTLKTIQNYLKKP